MFSIVKNGFTAQKQESGGFCLGDAGAAIKEIKQKLGLS